MTWQDIHRFLEEQSRDLERLTAIQQRQSDLFSTLVAASRNAAQVQAGGGGQSQLLNATKQMQETQMSFNLQYLNLQSQMQQESRTFAMISNIMKTKHDTVKNSIKNIR